MTISERIFKLMDERGISQIEFVRMTGISQSTVSDWKRKGTNPSADKILTICRVLNVTPYELLQESPEEEEQSVDYIYASKGTDNYELLIEIDSLNKKQKERLRGYLAAIKE